jgi:hypothetical protein
MDNTKSKLDAKVQSGVNLPNSGHQKLWAREFYLYRGSLSFLSTGGKWVSSFHGSSTFSPLAMTSPLTIAAT